jgi:hypothetical protein
MQAFIKPASDGNTEKKQQVNPAKWLSARLGFILEIPMTVCYYNKFVFLDNNLN